MSEPLSDVTNQIHHREKMTKNETNETKINSSLLENLSFVELIEKIDNQKELIDEAGFYFCKLSHQSIHINGRRCAAGLSRMTHKIRSDCIEIYDETLCSKLMRNFGKFIISLSINFDNLAAFDRYYSSIQHQIMEYCTDSLEELEVINCQNFKLHESNEAFKEMRNVSLTACDFDDKEVNLNRLFPNLDRLELLRNTLTNKDCIEKNIPGMSYLAISLNKNGFSKDNFLTALCFNQQLTGLHLLSNINSNILQSITEVTPFLEYLHLHITSYDFPDDQTIHFHNVKKLAITLTGSEFINFPIWFDHLLEMELTVNCGLGKDSMDFIIRNEKLIKLTIAAPSWKPVQLSDIDLMSIATKLPNLTDLTFQRCNISASGAIAFMKECKVLNDFRFTVENKNDDKTSLVAGVGNEWKLTEDEDSFRCERQ